MFLFSDEHDPQCYFSKTWPFESQPCSGIDVLCTAQYQLCCQSSLLSRDLQEWLQHQVVQPPAPSAWCLGRATTQQNSPSLLIHVSNMLKKGFCFNDGPMTPHFSSYCTPAPWFPPRTWWDFSTSRFTPHSEVTLHQSATFQQPKSRTDAPSLSAQRLGQALKVHPSWSRGK